VRCGVAVAPTIQANYTILGATFFRNYFVSFDYNSHTISIAQNAIMPQENELTGAIFFLFIVACGIVFLGFFIPIWYSLKNNCKRGKTIKMKKGVSTFMDVSIMDEETRNSMRMSREKSMVLME
jgi:Eukaryotic aspartyl protease